MEFDTTILEKLYTPLSWLVYELLAVILLAMVLFDVVKKNREKGISTLFTRLLEVFGFIFYAVIFENLGVIGKTYDYSFQRIMMFGVVPLEIPILEAVIFYSAMQFAEKLNFKKWSRPFVASLFGMLQDLTLDPVAVADRYLINGAIQGRWNWDPAIHYSDLFFKIPYFNYSGWFVLMFYYSALILVGRKIFDRYNKKVSVGVTYVVLSVLFGDLLIVSPLTLLLLYANPLDASFGNRTAEIIMLSINCLLIIAVLIVARKSDKRINLKTDLLIWVVPLAIHFLDFLVALIRGLYTALIPVIIFSLLHLLYLGIYCLPRKGSK